jgi:hypothetical protein
VGLAAGTGSAVHCIHFLNTHGIYLLDILIIYHFFIYARGKNPPVKYK